MKESDMEIVKNMTDAKLIVAIRDAVPDAKDTMRAQDICNKKRYAEDRSMLANKQLKATCSLQVIVPVDAIANTGRVFLCRAVLVFRE